MMTLFCLIAVGVFVVGSALSFLSFDKREWTMTMVGLAIMCIPLVMSYGLYKDKIEDNARYEARR